VARERVTSYLEKTQKTPTSFIPAETLLKNKEGVLPHDHWIKVDSDR